MVLGRWISQVNEISERSASVFVGLGEIVPTRFKEKALAWWHTLEPWYREKITQNWGTLREEIRSYWMNRSWVNRMQAKALNMKYRELGYSKETPTEYFIRKYELLTMVYQFTPSQIMAEVLQKAPRLWSTVLNPRNFDSLASFQTAIKYHEDLLIELGERYEHQRRSTDHQSRTYNVDSKTKSKSSPQRDKRSKPKSARTYAVGAPNAPAPKFPRDDSNVSKPKTPADYKARGCIFCGSTMHWDKECKYNKDRKWRSARTMFTDTDVGPEDVLGEMEYERCYEEYLNAASEETSDSGSEISSQEESTADHQNDESEGQDF
jgi:hypothetical protein